MISSLFWVTVGVFFGWNVQQPDWARQLQERVMKTVNELLGRSSR
jgi:hypothetical protein